MPLYIAFIDLTKAFDLVNRDGLFKAKIYKISIDTHQLHYISLYHFTI